MATGVDQKLLKSTKFPPEFNQKVDIRKVNVEVIQTWIKGRLTELLGMDDDVVIETCINLLKKDQFPKIKELQISLTGFLEKEAATFCKELWTLCLSAQSSSTGVPKELVEAKKQELLETKAEEEKAAEKLRQRREEERTRERDVESIRQRERGERGGRDRGRGGRGGRGYDRRSRSPPQYRRRGSPPSRRADADAYLPHGGRGRDIRGDRRRRSPSSPPRSRSRSPPRRNRRPRSPSPSRSRSRTPPRRIVRRERTRSRSRSIVSTRKRRAFSGSDGGAKASIEKGNGPRGDRKRRPSIDISRSPSPRPYRRRRSSTPPRSRSPRERQHKRARRSPASRSRSTSGRPRSRSPRYGRRDNRSRRYSRRSPSRDSYDRRADVRRGRYHDDDDDDQYRSRGGRGGRGRNGYERSRVDSSPPRVVRRNTSSSRSRSGSEPVTSGGKGEGKDAVGTASA